MACVNTVIEIDVVRLFENWLKFSRKSFLKKSWRKNTTIFWLGTEEKNNWRATKVFYPSWEHYEHMAFIESPPQADESINTINKPGEMIPPVRQWKNQKTSKNETENAKTMLWKAWFWQPMISKVYQNGQKPFFHVVEKYTHILKKRTLLWEKV